MSKEMDSIFERIYDSFDQLEDVLRDTSSAQNLDYLDRMRVLGLIFNIKQCLDQDIVATLLQQMLCDARKTEALSALWEKELTEATEQ
jgi:hypothetical protein